ncbi:signal recognition particle subunit SRP19/SEC65 family protein [[Eubacterium] cellulosolvens]
MKNPGRLVIWPANLDNRKTRKKGRRIPKSEAVESPRIHELLNVTKKLSLNPEQHENAALPSSWWEKTGYLLIDKKKPRRAHLQEIAQEIKNMRKTSPVKK